MRRVPLAALLALAACAPPVATATPPACPPTRGWTAWIDAMPGPGARPRLIVTAEAALPAGTRAALTPGPTDRMMPPGQRIALSLVPEAGAPGGWQPARVEIAPALPSYREVIVTCGGEAVGRIAGADIATVH